MKMIVYQTKTGSPIPFNESFKLLGGNETVWLSDKGAYDGQDVEVLLDGEKDKLVFLVPEARKNEFEQLLEDKLGQIAWQEDSSPQKPPKEEIGSGWPEELAKFYDEEVQVVTILQSTIKSEEIPMNKTASQSSFSPKESEQEEIALAMRVFSQIKKLPIIIAICAVVLMTFFIYILGDIETLKQRQVPMLLLKAEDAKKEADVLKRQYWCGRASSVITEKMDEARNELDNVCREDNEVTATTVASTPTLPTEEEVRGQREKIKNEYSELADDAIGRSWYMTKRENNQDVERGSAFWYAKQIWEIQPLHEEIRILKFQEVNFILQKIVKEYADLPTIRCKNVRKIYEFTNGKSELGSTKSVIESQNYWNTCSNHQ